MEVNDLINFNTLSPILPINENVCDDYKPRLSDVNNPFDNVLKKSMNCPLNAPVEDRKLNFLTSDNKENLNLISPLKTPGKTKKFNKISTSPLFLKTNSSENLNPNIVRRDLDHLTYNDSTTNNSINNSSFGILHESFLNDTLNNAFNSPGSEAFVQTPPQVVEEGKLIDLSKSGEKSKIKCDECSDFVDQLKINMLDGKNITSFLCEHHNEISRIASNISKFNNMVLDDGFIMTSTDSDFDQPFRRRSMSASKAVRPKNLYQFTSRKRLNGSFDSQKFEYLDKEKLVTLDSITAPWEEDDSILPLLEINADNLLISTPKSNKNASKITITKTETVNIETKNIQTSSSDDNISPIKSSPENSSKDQINLNESFTISSNDNVKPESTKCDPNIESSIKEQEESHKNSPKNVSDLVNNIKDFLHTKSNGVSSDEKKMGEDLLFSLAKALDVDLENSVCHKLSKSFTEKTIDNSEKDNLSKSKVRLSLPEQKNQSMTNDKVDSSKSTEGGKKIEKPKLGVPKIGGGKLEIKTNFTKGFTLPKLTLNKRSKAGDNDKPGNKGPLKAVIPLKNMEKNKKPITPVPLKKLNRISISTPPNVLMEPKRTSTPLVPPNIKPQAQSTPHFQKNPQAIQNSVTPNRYQKRSSLPRPSSSPDINKSPSPRNVTKNSSGSVPNLSITSPSVNVIRDSSKIIYRRKSASDLKSGKTNTSMETKKDGNSSSSTSRPTVKRRFSFNKDLK